MDWVGIASIIGSIASIIGAAISIRQSSQAKKAKDASVAAQEATEVARDKILQNIQYENFVSFQKECSKFEGFLLKASKTSKGQHVLGKSENYVEDGLEDFLTRFNLEIGKTSGVVREELQRLYNTLCSKRNTVDASNRNAILGLLDDVRKLSRSVVDTQMKNKLSV